MADIKIRTEGKAGLVTLARPKALNALTADMIAELESALDNWRDDPSIKLIIFDAEGEKAFCAGGDIAQLYEQGTKGEFHFGRAFWRNEYRLNLKIADYPKPIVAFLQGFTMGGGVGVGCHASHRIVCESSKIAMPECGIGLIPDVGGSYLLGRAPNGIGTYLGLTGARMTAPDAIHVGFADYFVPAEKWEELHRQLIESGEVTAVIETAKASGEGPLAAMFDTIKDCFDQDSVAEIATALDAAGTEASAAALKGLRKGSPLSVACALETIRAGATLDLAGALAQEYRFAHRSQDDGDFLEGIRAQIIDRDFKPNWKHAGLDVPQDDIAAMLAPLGADEWSAQGRTA